MFSEAVTINRLETHQNVSQTETMDARDPEWDYFNNQRFNYETRVLCMWLINTKFNDIKCIHIIFSVADKLPKRPIQPV